MKVKPMYLVAAAGAFFVIKNLDSNGATKRAVTPPAAPKIRVSARVAKQKNPALMLPQRELTSEEEKKVLGMLLSHNNLNEEARLVTPRTDAELIALGVEVDNKGNPVIKDRALYRQGMLEEQYQSLLMDFDEVIAYYPNLKDLPKLRNDLDKYKDQLVVQFSSVGMGPISGFGGVY